MAYDNNKEVCDVIETTVVEDTQPSEQVINNKQVTVE